MGSLTLSQQKNITLTFPYGPFSQGLLPLFSFSRGKGRALKIISVVEYVDFVANFSREL